jgi:hypothetical protein
MVVSMDFDQLPIGETWDLPLRLYFDLNTRCLEGIQHTIQHPHLKVFTHRVLIWTINFRFGVHKVKTTYIPSNQMQDFIDEKEHCSDTNWKFTCRQL